MGAPSNALPLRSSCDWCRAQKLRCVQVPNSGPHAPCQRCRKAKPPRTCHFSTRSRSGRAPKNILANVQSVHAKDLPSFAAPWSAVLSIPLPTPSSSDDNPPPSSITSPEKNQDGLASNDGNAASIICQDDDAFSSLLTAETIEWDTSEWYPATSRDPSVTDEYGDTPENEITFAFETTPTYDMDLDFNVNFPLLSGKTPCHLGQDLTAQRPCGIIELSTLLADMAHYESEISMLSGGDLDKYPIGDALFLSQRFSNILSNEIYNKFVDTSLLDAPITLLMLSCYMMLMRIFSSVLGHMIQHLLKLHGAHQTSSPAGPSAPCILSYRGLSLGQLQPSAEKDLATRAKKAISMMLDSLHASEKAMGLEADARIVGVGLKEMSRDTCLEPTESYELNGGTLWKGGPMVNLTNSPLQEEVRNQSVRLRGKIKHLNSLFARFLDI